jgi:flagellar biosynthesis component FlhA
MSVVVKVLQYLLLERVPIRNLRTICETLAELAPKVQDPVVWWRRCASRSAAASCRTSADCARSCR